MLTTLKKQQGFTIIELLIVIVIIAILAAITLVAYNNIQARARDSIRKQDLATIAEALKMYSVDHGDYVGAGSGCGSSGSGSGWFSANDYSPNLPVSTCLINAGSLSKVLIDPSGEQDCATGTDCHAYIKINCTSTTTYLYANLETMPHSSTDTDATCMPTYDTDYNMNYVVKVN